MKRVFRLLLIFSFILLPFKVLAVGDVTVSTTGLTIEKGKTATFTINVNNALGRVDITSNNTSIATVSNASVYLNSDEATSKTITVSAVAAGSTTITVNKTDVASFDSEQKTGSYTITVNVVEPEVKSEETTTNQNNTPKSNTTTKSNTNKNTTKSNTTNNTVDNANSENLKRAIAAVENAENSLSQNDYEIALALVNNLEDNAEKTALLERLKTVADKIDTKSLETETTCEECKECNNRAWIIISSALLILLIVENVYLVLEKNAEDKEMTNNKDNKKTNNSKNNSKK